MSEEKVFDQTFQANTNQGTPSADELDRLVASDAAKQLSGEELVEEPKKVAKVREETEESPETSEETEESTEKPAEDEETRKRIARLAADARQAKRELKAAKEELARARGELPALPQDKEIERQINERAAQLAAQVSYNDSCNKIFEEGTKEFPDFDKLVRTMNTELGVMPVPMVEAAIETGNPHRIIHWLANNLDESERIRELPPHKMGAAIAKIASKAEAPVKAQSKAPPPIKPISSTNSNPTKNPEKMSMAEFCKWQDEADKKRRYR